MVKLRSFIVNITTFSQTTEDYKIAARYQIAIGIWTFRTLTKEKISHTKEPSQKVHEAK